MNSNIGTFEIAPFGANLRPDAEEVRRYDWRFRHHSGGRWGAGFGNRFAHGFGHRFEPGFGHRFRPGFAHDFGHGFAPGFGHRFGFGHGFHHRFPFRPSGWPGVPAAPDVDSGGPPPDAPAPAVGGAPPDVAPAGFGSTAEQIRWVQFTLNSVLGTNLPTDGVPSPDLRAALQTFQSQQGLPASGFAGPDTIAALQCTAANASVSASAPAAAAPEPQPTADGQSEELGWTGLHKANCNCPGCRAAASGFGVGIGRPQTAGDTLGEEEELELALELLNVRNDQELEQFLGDVLKTIGKGLKSVGSFAAKNILPVVGPALKQIAKTALPLAGGALGTLIPIPGVGTALGSALGGAVADALEMEVAGLDHEDADIERARCIVRLARSVMREVALSPGSGAPEAIVHAALIYAAGKHLPAAVHEVAAMMPAPTAAGTSAQPGSRGTWRRHGSQIVVEDA